MKINWYAIILITLGLVIAVSAWPDARAWLWQSHLGSVPDSTGYGQAKIKFSDVAVTAQVPLSASLQAKGLGGRTSLPDDQAMAWIYPQAGAYQFWMKDMLIPLDFIWVDQGRVVDLTQNVPPPAPGQSTGDLPILQPNVPASVVVEVRAGFVADHRISVGDPVEIDTH